MEVMVKVKSELVSADVCLVEAAPLKELHIIVANALVKPIESNKEITVPIRLINPSAESVTLYKGSTVACVSGIDPSIVVANVNPNPSDTHPDVSKAEEELLWELVCGSGQGQDVQQQDKFYALLLSFANVFALDDKQLGQTNKLQHIFKVMGSHPIRQPTVGGYHHSEGKKYINY